jgi:hypothetical protein
MLVLHSADRIDSLCSCTCRSFSRSYRPSMPHERLGHCFSEAPTSRFTLTRWRLTSATSRGMPVHSTGPRSSRVSFLQRASWAALFTRCVSRQECAPSRASVDGPGITLEPWHGGTSEHFYFARATSTRRFSARPLAVALSATGRVVPNPCGTSWLAVTLCVVSQVTTDFARPWESGRLCASLP